MAKTARKKTNRALSNGSGRFVVPSTISRRDYFKDGSDDWFRDSLYRLVQALSRLLVCREAFGRRLGLTGSQFTVLMGVAYRQGDTGITIASLANYIGLAATHVTTEVGRLIRKGLLVKRPNESDGRSVLISLSAKGEEAVEIVSPMVRKINDLLFMNIDRKQFDTTNEFAKVLLTNAEYAIAEIRVSEADRAAK
ncbi:MarR family transcriptional regulator [Microbacteriaceae bacterium K1510]|nr:MarR family transcriptional regulator [Microbacteriaceae bacterium K1510]